MKASDSKCWTCKHGLCVKETENQKIVHECLPEDEVDQYNIFDESESLEPITSDLTHTHIKAICFWKPITTKEAPPIVVSMVEECNRYEQNM